MRTSVCLLAGFSLLIPAGAVAQGTAAQKPPAAQAAKPAPDADKQEVKVSPKVLQTYVGEYELRADWVLTVTLEEGSLWGQPTNQQKRQMVADSPTKFHLKELPVTLEFQKDADGKVTSVHMVQEGRGERDLKKIK
ncbi:MAG TPA: DUF3471 domain-containing protein [Vicinamibacterales bacterium]